MTTTLQASSSTIRAEGLTKSFGQTRALDGVDLDVPAGTVLGLLGPNGAGKTTTVRVLTTLLRADGGSASVAGADVMRQPQMVRSLIGLTGQYAAIDENLTGAENLRLIGWLLDIPRRPARARAGELLDRFDLGAAANRPAKTYSGGMRRRLDLAASLMGNPRVLFLDEPTTGLDPRSRLALWDVIRALVADGTTVLLTTQYLEEADALADFIVVIDGGRAVARGTADELKSATGGAALHLRPADPAQLGAAVEALASFGVVADPDGLGVSVPLRADSHSVLPDLHDLGPLTTAALARLGEARIGLADISLRRPSLDDVFLALTGKAAADEASSGPSAR